jgi:hypothetical protein
MQCTLLIPRLFWPRHAADTVAHGLALPALTTILARSSAERYPAVAPEAWLCQAFEVERQQDWPVAPLTLALDHGDPGDAYWLRADPVHIKVSREGLHLVDNALFDVSDEEAQALVTKLNEHFAGQDVTFHAPNPKRWYARVGRRPELVTSALREVAGKDVQQHLPTGADALAWHGMFNEIQMLLHDHPLNEAREARGEPEMNSVWFWGGGTTPAVPGRHFASVSSNDPTALALAAAGDTHAVPLPADAGVWLGEIASAKSNGESHLAVLDDLATAVTYDDPDAWRTRITALEARWFAPLVNALGRGHIEALALVALGEETSCRFSLHRPDLLKFWRRAKALSAYA